MTSSISAEIDKIGNKMVKCKNDSCKGVLNKHCVIRPRCLYLHPETEKGIGCIVVGVNPGILNENNIEYMEYNKKREVTYEDQKKYFSTSLEKESQYYSLLTNVLDSLNLKKDHGVLWTELCKCQKSDPNQELPIQTIGKCITKHLKWELRKVDEKIPIVAVSWQVYIILGALYPSRPLIGVNHPTSSRINYKEYIEKCKKRTGEVEQVIEAQSCIWLKSDRKSRKSITEGIQDS